VKYLCHALIVVALVAPPSVLADDTAASKPMPLASAATGQSPSRAHDRLQLDSTAITGNRELPKVMSIVPWKEAEPPGGADRPMNSLVDEILAPLDRDEFQREVTYFRDLTSPASPVPSSPSPGVPKQ
jgi:hypothetical protein